MKKIIKKSDSENDMTVFTVIGKVTANELVASISDFYDNYCHFKYSLGLY